MKFHYKILLVSTFYYLRGDTGVIDLNEMDEGDNLLKLAKSGRAKRALT